MNVGTYKTRKQALSAANNFRKGSKNDISNRYSVSYRVEKAGKNSKNYKIVSTLKPKKKTSIKTTSTKSSRGIARFDSNIPRGGPLGYRNMQEYYAAQKRSRTKRPSSKPPETITRSGKRFTLEFTKLTENAYRNEIAKVDRKKLSVRTVKNSNGTISVYTRNKKRS